MKNKVWVYIHIPFCDVKCKYCRFASIWVIQKPKIEKYFNFLLNEINNPTFKINKKVGLNSVYFWWWNPTSLEPEQIRIILENLKKNYWFKKNIEITLETNPNKITKDNLIYFKNIWINRISIWVQTLNQKSLLEIWRGNKWNIVEALNNIKEIWFINISLDFIIWLPFVKKWEIKKNIEFLLNKYDFIKHISVYMLEDQIPLPNLPLAGEGVYEKDYLGEYIEIKEFLKKRWFFSYEISNFAKPWYECGHNKWYWDHSEILAFWLWAHWYLDWIRYAHSDSFKWYYNNEIIFEEKQTIEDIFLEKLLFWLRTTWIKKNIFSKLNQEKINYFINNWFLKIENNTLKLENKWVLVLDYILGEIV